MRIRLVLMNEHDIDDSGLTPAGAIDQELDPTLCAECQGLGVLPDGEACPVCDGTGKPTGRTGGG